MPPGQVIWAGIYAFVIAFSTAIATAGPFVMGINAWLIAISGSVAAGFVAGKKSWDTYKLELVPLERPLRKYPE